MYLSAPFNLQNFYIKKILELIQNYGVRHRWDQNNPFVLNKIFLSITIIIIFIYLWTFSLCKTVFKVVKVVHLPQIVFFFRKPVNEPCFFYSCLSTCQQSKSDINLLVKCWWFKNTEISLAESHFFLYLRTRFFQSMQFSQDVNEP